MANRKPELLTMVLRLLCGAADGQQRTLQATPLDPESLHIDLESISRADNLGRVLADDLLAQGAELDLSTASYNKAVAVLYRIATVLLRELENHFDPVDNGRQTRLYKWSVFVNDEPNESLRAVYGTPTMEAQAFGSDPSPIILAEYSVPQRTYLAGKQIVVLVTPFTAAHWSPQTSQNFNHAVGHTARAHRQRQLPLTMPGLVADLAERFEYLEFLDNRESPRAVIACPKIICGYSVPNGHILLYPNVFEGFPVVGASVQPQVIAALLPAAVGH